VNRSSFRLRVNIPMPTRLLNPDFPALAGGVFLWAGPPRHPMLFEHEATPAEYGAGLKLAVERGWTVLTLT
jgi:hypothetical protein